MLQRKKWPNGWKSFGKTDTKNKKISFSQVKKQILSKSFTIKKTGDFIFSATWPGGYAEQDQTTDYKSAGASE
jgi:hypothetical protein